MLYAQTATRTYTWSDAAIAVSDRICMDVVPKAQLKHDRVSVRRPCRKHARSESAEGESRQRSE